MALTQSQLEEAMKPPCFDTPIASVGGQCSSVSDPLLPSSSMPTKERSFSSAASPINSLLAGEKICFGNFVNFSMAGVFPNCGNCVLIFFPL